MALTWWLNMTQDKRSDYKVVLKHQKKKAGEKHVILKVFFKLHNAVTCPVALSTLTYTHNIDNTQLHTRSHMVGPENTQLHALRTHFLLTPNYTRA